MIRRCYNRFLWARLRIRYGAATRGSGQSNRGNSSKSSFGTASNGYPALRQARKPPAIT